MGPPPPPGLPIDSSVTILLIIAIVYGVLIIRGKLSEHHLKNCPICNSKKINRLQKSSFYKGMPILSKKYECNKCENLFVILLFSKQNRKELFKIKGNR